MYDQLIVNIGNHQFQVGHPVLPDGNYRIPVAENNYNLSQCNRT